MASTGESADQVQLQTTMAYIERFVQWVRAGQIDDKDLHRHRILVLLLDPHGDVPSRPRFFAPYAPELPDPTADYVGREFVTGHLVHAAEWPQPVINYLTRYLRFIYLDLPNDQNPWELDMNSACGIEPEFDVYPCEHLWVSSQTNSSKPHLKFIHWSKQESNDDALACSELSYICRVICSYLPRRRFQSRMICPILVISLNGSRARVLEAYFDGERLVVRRTRPYDFADGDMGTFKTLARWYLADAVGDTGQGALDRLDRI
ncbi:uncharacterized protein LDX57_002692 [Aspergillus melleus]|uniref:uncharacterized protein n=1 Tax=Aspergillus melleus TaxID=138277 RepID=UPI001E8D7704|nr:uncharacterized protein LDX57_002692 [Aspergillus melleus]KAH8424946.1 hypothetical protein LDX57_002692 [Aspergillus melleus]